MATYVREILYHLDLGNFWETGAVENEKKLTRLRLHTNRLEIVRYIYSGVHENDHICQNCQPNIVVEDEIHFMLYCPKYTIDKIQMLNIIGPKKNISKNSNWHHWSETSMVRNINGPKTDV